VLSWFINFVKFININLNINSAMVFISRTVKLTEYGVHVDIFTFYRGSLLLVDNS
jgi:hypothetical protein